VPRHHRLHSLAVAVCSKLLTEIRGLGCQKRKAPAGGWGLGGLGLLIFETKTHPVTAGIMIDERNGSLPDELNWIACIPLLLLLFGKEVADFVVAFAFETIGSSIGPRQHIADRLGVSLRLQ
jgi:hypothetical protein